MHDGAPRITCDLEALTKYGKHIERVELIIQEPDVDTDGRGTENIFHYDVMYAALQKEVQSLAIRIISDPTDPAQGYTVRDWLEEETYRDYKHWGTMHHWHLEVCRTRGKTSGAVKYKGMQTFRDSDGDCLHFGNRVEGEGGLVEWDAPGWGTKRIWRPKWVVEFANGDV